jgi:hypothetical protein
MLIIEDTYLPSLHLSTVELQVAKRIASCDMANYDFESYAYRE